MAQLVPDISRSLDRLFGGIAAGARGQAIRQGQEAQRFQQEQIRGQTDILTSGVGGKKEEAALLRLSSLNPQVGNAMRQALERGDQQELAAANAQAEKGFKEATFLQNQESFAGKRNALLSLGRAEAAREGGDPSRILKLLELPEEQLNTEIQRMLTMGVDLKTLTTRTVLGPEQRLVTASGQEVARGLGKRETRTALAKNLELAGIDPKSAEGKKIIKESIVKPGVKIDINKQQGFKVPNGFMLLDENDPTKGVTPIPGGPQDTIKGENAGKVQMLRTAQKAFSEIRGLVFKKDGSLDNTNLFTSNLDIPFTGRKGVPLTEGATLRARFEFGIQAITRLETGAAMPDNELQNTRTRFQPSVTDSKEVVELKLDMYEDFINGTLKLVDPSGRLDAERFDAAVVERGGNPADFVPTESAQVDAAPAQPDQPIVVDF